MSVPYGFYVFSPIYFSLIYFLITSRAVWVDLTGDGRLSLLTARALSPLGSKAKPYKNQDSEKNAPRKPKSGQLVCLEMPRPHRFDEATGTPLESDGTIFDPFNPEHLPWKTQ